MPILSISEAARLAGIDRRTLQRQIARGTVSMTAAPHGSRGIELSELLRVYPAAAMPSGADAIMPQAAARQSEVAPPAAELRHAQDRIYALEDKIADMRAQLEAAQRRELWLQGQIDQIQQRLLPAPRQGIIERIAEAIARLKRPKGNT